MLLRNWHELPEKLRNERVRPYYDSLKKKKTSLLFKLLFDKTAALLLLVFLLPVFAILAAAVKLDSEGDVFFRQVRITRYGKEFNIYKFRTMVNNAESIGRQVTLDGDRRITGIGKFLRRLRLDELPQLINILKGEMSFVGARPEVVCYAKEYTDEMLATLLLPAGVTSEACLKFKDEEKYLRSAINADEVYLKKIMPVKIRINLDNLMSFTFRKDLETILHTVNFIVKSSVARTRNRKLQRVGGHVIGRHV